MRKILGYSEMKNKVGKVVFIQIEDKTNGVVGTSCDKLFLYDDVSKKIDANSIGKHIEVEYGCGYSGKAYIANVNIK